MPRKKRAIVCACPVRHPVTPAADDTWVIGGGALLFALFLVVDLCLNEPTPQTYHQWLAHVDQAWELRAGEQTLYLGMRERFGYGQRWYAWEPTGDGQGTVVPAATAQQLLRLFGDHAKPVARPATTAEPSPSE